MLCDVIHLTAYGHSIAHPLKRMGEEWEDIKPRLPCATDIEKAASQCYTDSKIIRGERKRHGSQ